MNINLNIRESLPEDNDGGLKMTGEEQNFLLKVSELIGTNTEEEWNGLRVKMLKLRSILEKRYGDPENKKDYIEDFKIKYYRLWHKLIGSTPNRIKLKYFDTPKGEIRYLIENWRKLTVDDIKNI